MQDATKLRLHPTKAGGVSGPVMGRFSNKAVLQFGASLLAGLITTLCAKSLLMGAVVPLAAFVVLLALAGKPEGYALQWIEWQNLKRRGKGLFEWEFSNHGYDQF